MAMTRSEFLRSLAVGAGAALSGLAPLRACETARGTSFGQEKDDSMTETFSRATFAQHLDSGFRILDRSSPTVVEAKLVEVSEVPSSGKTEQFSLLFKGPKEPLLSQKTYVFEHARMGTFDLFIVPIAADDTGTSYEAVFNRTRK